MEFSQISLQPRRMMAGTFGSRMAPDDEEIARAIDKALAS
jgi:hypothetical protein